MGNVVPETLHSLRSLLFTATNGIPHDRFIKFTRRSMFGTPAPLWMTEPGPVYVRKHIRDKYDPIVGEVELLNANQNHAVTKYPEGREVTVSARDIAPTATPSNTGDQQHMPENECTAPSTGSETSNVELQTPLNWRSNRPKKPSREI